MVGLKKGRVDVKDMVHIDGSMGEGGGQVLRTSLSLSIITARPLDLVNIRSRRDRPGIQRQHLAAVEAARKICSARVEGAKTGSSAILFVPGKTAGGTYELSIDSAGSATLVMQTILLPLMLAPHSSHVVIEGGTHNIWAPPVDFLDRVFLPLVRRMGPSVTVHLTRYGFHPAGGGLVHAAIDPVSVLKPIDVNERGKIDRIRATALVSRLPESIGHREIKVVKAELGDDIEGSVKVVDSRGPGNVLFVEIFCDRITEIITSFGRRGLPAEKVALNVAREAQDYIRSGAPVGLHLADQLVLPFALTGAGSFTTMAPTRHFSTNVEVIKKFLPVDIRTEQMSGDAWKVTVNRS